MNRIVWITGGSSGIGAALVKKYSDSGYYVIATARSKDQLEKVASSSNYPENIKIFPADLEKVNELSKIIQSVWNIFDGIDLVILNAGVGQWGEVIDTEMSVERKIFELNFWSPVQSIKLLIPKMENKGSGTIICVGSIASQFGQAKLAAYSASKSALISQSKVLSREVGGYNVRVNCIAPGLVNTDMLNKNTSSEIIEKMIQNISLRRIANPIDIANVVLFLSSDLSKYITGQVIRVDGGI